MGQPRPSGVAMSESAHARKAPSTLNVASGFLCAIIAPFPPLHARASPATRRRAVSRTQTAASPQWRETASPARDRPPRRQWASTVDKPDGIRSPMRRRRLGIGDRRLGVHGGQRRRRNPSKSVAGRFLEFPMSAYPLLPQKGERKHRRQRRLRFRYISQWVEMVGATGIEPVTPSMSTRCSPAELRARAP